MSRPRKNKKFIDPRYFMDEKTEVLNEGWVSDYNAGNKRVAVLSQEQVQAVGQAGLDQSLDLYNLALQAKGDSSGPYAQLFDTPAFQADARVKEIGY